MAQTYKKKTPKYYKLCAEFSESFELPQAEDSGSVDASGQ
jgi:hypothetical protein